MTTKILIFFNVAQGLNSWSFWGIASHLPCSVLGMPRDGFVLMHMDMSYCILTIAFEFHLHSSTCICIWLLLWFPIYNHGFLVNLAIFMSISEIMRISCLQTMQHYVFLVFFHLLGFWCAFAIFSITLNHV
jgi:hypothetical protein